MVRIKHLIPMFARLERTMNDQSLASRPNVQKTTVFTLNRILEKNVDENEPLPEAADDEIPTYLKKIRDKRKNSDGAWHRKYKELQLNVDAEKRNLKRGIEIVENQKSEAKKTRDSCPRYSDFHLVLIRCGLGISVFLWIPEKDY